LVEAENIDLAFDVLKDKNLSIISLIEQKKSILTQQAILTRIKSKDIVILSRQFAVLVSANVSLVQSLKILIEQTSNPKMKIAIAEIADEVDGGLRLSDALGKRPNIFSNFYVSVVRSGETSGKLDEVLNYLADEMEKDYDMTAKIKGAMYYPAFIFSGLLILAIFMMVKVVPVLTNILKESGTELPLATTILVNISAFMVSYWWVLLLLIFFSSLGIFSYIRTPQGKYILDWTKLRLPIFGPLLQKIYLVRFTRSMETLILGGVSIINSLKIASDVVSNDIYKQLILETIKEVEDGNSISSIFAQSKEIPRMVSEMMSIGEKTGKLDNILAQISIFYSREISNTTNNMMTLMEPIIMVIMGLAVGFMVAAIIMPMYNMSGSIS
jgi:type IV pilus assembly protein PilC